MANTNPTSDIDALSAQYNSIMDEHTNNTDNPDNADIQPAVSDPPPMFSAVNISEMGPHNPFPSEDYDHLNQNEDVANLYDQQSMDQNPSSSPNDPIEPTEPKVSNPFEDGFDPLNIDNGQNVISKGFTDDFNGMNMSPTGMPPPVLSQESIDEMNFMNVSSNSNGLPNSTTNEVHSIPEDEHMEPAAFSPMMDNQMDNNLDMNDNYIPHHSHHGQSNSFSNPPPPPPMPKRVSTSPELFRLTSPKEIMSSKSNELPTHQQESSMYRMNASIPAPPSPEMKVDDHARLSNKRSHSHSRGASARMLVSGSPLKPKMSAKGRSVDDMMHNKGNNALLEDVSFDSVLRQADVGVEMTDRLKEVIRKFCKHQQMGADKLQEIYTKLPPTYKDVDGMKDFADLSALVHELILQTVAAQKRLADFLVKDVVPRMDAHIKEKQQQLQRIKHDNRQAEMKVKNAVSTMTKASNQAKQSAQKAKQLAVSSGGTSKQYAQPKKKGMKGVNLTGVFNKLKNNPHADLPEEEQAYLKAQKLQKDYEAAVMAANYEQDTYNQICARFKRECKDLEKGRLKYSKGKVQQFVNAHRQYFGNESIMLLQTRIMSALDALNPDREFDRFLQRTIQENKSRGNVHKRSVEFVMKKYDYQNVFHSLQDSMDITRKLMPQRMEKIPLMVTVLCDKVRELNGFQTEGIFRKSAMATEIERLKGKLNQDDYRLDMKSPHVAACLLKDWLRGLKDSLIPQSHYDMAIDMAKKNQVKQESLEVFLSQLPEVNRETIKYLVKFLQEMIKEEHVPETRMNLENVAIVFAPTMMKCPHSDMKVLMANSQFEKKFIIALIGELRDY